MLQLVVAVIYDTEEQQAQSIRWRPPEDVGPVPRADTGDEEREPAITEIGVALLVGICTGSAVVVFNTLVHGIQDEIWKGKWAWEGFAPLRARLFVSAMEILRRNVGGGSCLHIGGGVRHHRVAERPRYPVFIVSLACICPPC